MVFWSNWHLLMANSKRKRCLSTEQMIFPFAYIDKPARLIIRLFFLFVSDSILVKPNKKTFPFCTSPSFHLTWHSGRGLVRFVSKKAWQEFLLEEKVQKIQLVGDKTRNKQIEPYFIFKMLTNTSNWVQIIFWPDCYLLVKKKTILPYRAHHHLTFFSVVFHWGSQVELICRLRRRDGLIWSGTKCPIPTRLVRDKRNPQRRYFVF